MRIFGNKLPIRKENCVVAIGAFDGLHLGHKTIVNKLISRARRLGVKSLVITFDSHPRKILKKNHTFGVITSNEDKAAILKTLGVDMVWFLKTDLNLLNMPAHDFLLFVNKYFSIKELIAGDDFRFGKDALHGAHTMEKLACEFGFNYQIVNKQKQNNKFISSSAVRRMLAGGDVYSASKFLGRLYCVKGVVVAGKGNGMRFGFPTANILVKDYIIPSSGVYAGKCIVGHGEYITAINIGSNPTVNRDGKETLEAHLLDFKKNIVGKNVELYFFKKLRNEKKFSSIENLINAIKNDVQYIRANFGLNYFIVM